MTPTPDAEPLPTLTSIPTLWNPKAAWWWSLPLSWGFGGYLLAQNWKTLGNQEMAKRCMIWFYSSIPFWLLRFATEGIETLETLLGLCLFIGWCFFYRQEVRAQTAFINQECGSDYPRKTWLKPIGLALISLVLSYGMFGKEKTARRSTDLANQQISGREQVSDSSTVPAQVQIAASELHGRQEVKPLDIQELKPQAEQKPIAPPSNDSRHNNERITADYLPTKPETRAVYYLESVLMDGMVMRKEHWTSKEGEVLRNIVSAGEWDVDGSYRSLKAMSVMTLEQRSIKNGFVVVTIRSSKDVVDSEEQVLKLGAKVNDSWPVSAKYPDLGRRRVVRFGTFYFPYDESDHTTAIIETTTSSQSGIRFRSVHTYAKGIGLIETEGFRSQNGEESTTSKLMLYIPGKKKLSDKFLVPFFQ